MDLPAIQWHGVAKVIAHAPNVRSLGMRLSALQVSECLDLWIRETKRIINLDFGRSPKHTSR